MRKLLYLGAALTGSAGFALTDQGTVANQIKPRPSITALRVEQPPVIDGVLDEGAWQKAPAAGDFMQYEPRDGVPMTERTEFRVLYDARALYIGIWCYDSEPNKILARTMSRDDYPDEDDFVSFSIDPFLDNAQSWPTVPLVYHRRPVGHYQSVGEVTHISPTTRVHQPPDPRQSDDLNSIPQTYRPAANAATVRIHWSP